MGEEIEIFGKIFTPDQTKVLSKPTIMDLIFPSEGWILPDCPQNPSIGSVFLPTKLFCKQKVA